MEPNVSIQIRAYDEAAIAAMAEIWNEVVRAGVAFPQIEELSLSGAQEFFAAQSYCGIAQNARGTCIGLYILHPNNVGRCGHICNASYAVASAARGQGAGEALVRDCITQARSLGFRILQFNAVVRSNTAARRLYEKLGFIPLGVIPGGFRMPDGHYEDIVPYYLVL